MSDEPTFNNLDVLSRPWEARFVPAKQDATGFSLSPRLPIRENTTRTGARRAKLGLDFWRERKVE